MSKVNEMTLVKMLGIVKDIGTVKSAMWNEDGYISVEGTTVDGNLISMTLWVKEDKNDA